MRKTRKMALRRVQTADSQHGIERIKIMLSLIFKKIICQIYFFEEVHVKKFRSYCNFSFSPMDTALSFVYVKITSTQDKVHTDTNLFLFASHKFEIMYTYYHTNNIFLFVNVTTKRLYEGRSKSFEPYPLKRKVDK